MRWLAVLLVLTGLPVLARPEPTGSPASAFAAAAADARTLSPEVAHQTRYLSAYHLTAAERDILRLDAVQRFVANSLSRNSELIAPRPVAPDLWAVILSDYGWDEKTWEKFADIEPYFHLTKEVEVTKEVAYGVYADPVAKTGWKQTEVKREKAKSQSYDCSVGGRDAGPTGGCHRPHHTHRLGRARGPLRLVDGAGGTASLAQRTADRGGLLRLAEDQEPRRL